MTVVLPLLLLALALSWRAWVNSPGWDEVDDDDGRA
jgi:hypothetical protein